MPFGFEPAHPIPDDAAGNAMPYADGGPIPGQPLDINRLLVHHPTATFFVRMEGDAMRAAGIFHGDILVVDRTYEPRPGQLVVAGFNGEFLVRHLRREGEQITLEGAGRTPSIRIPEGEELQLFGVVTAAIRRFMP